MTEPDTEPGLEGGPGQQRSPRSPGAALLAERRSQGLSLGDIARQLKLSVRQVEALERDEYGSFSGSVFVRGFLRNYAKLLRLDPDRLLEAAGESIAPLPVNEPAPPHMPMASPNREGRHRILTWGAFGVLAVVVLFLLASNVSKEQREPQVAEQPLAPAAPPAPHPAEPPSGAVSQPTAAPMTPAEPVSVVPAPENPAAVAASPAAAGAELSEAPVAAESISSRRANAEPPQSGNPPAEESLPVTKPRVLVSGSGSSQIRMVFEDESWVEVRDGSGDTIFSRLNAPGTERLIRGQPPFVVVVGNAHAVKLLYRGKSIDLGPHTRVDVARVTLE
jgi:cytoskeleton protein RodZ